MRLARFVVLGAVVLAPATALAGNGLHERVPVLFHDQQCMIVQQTGESYHITYGIPGNHHEEPPPGDQEESWEHPRTEDEVSDSRTHQFLAFLRGRGPQEPLPQWITWADLDREAAIGSIDPADYTDEDVLETAATWDGLFVRISPDDARFPISCESAVQGVDFAPTDVGVYVIEGYTWEPPFNVWVKRYGAIKVVEDINDPDAGPPAMSIMNGEEIVYKNESFDIVGCVDAMDGSTVTGEWAVSDTNPDWLAFMTDEPVMSGQIVIPFDPPEAAEGEQITVRLTLTDPTDRTYTAYMNEISVVLPASSGCEETDSGGSFIGMPCDTDDTGGEGGDEFGDLCEGEGTTTNGDDSGTGTTGASTGTSASTSGPSSTNGTGQDESSGGSCNCSATPDGMPTWLLGLGLFALVRRRTVAAP